MEKLLGHCDAMYTSAQACFYGSHDAHDSQASHGKNCKSCLDTYHYDSCSAAYTYETGCHYYVGQFSSRFANEMYSALYHTAKATAKPLRVLSLGYGPATELCSLDCLQREGTVSSYAYHGVDLNTNWSNIHDFYRNNLGEDVSFNIDNAIDFIARTDITQYNVIVLNYFISNMIKFYQLSSARNLLDILQRKMQKAGHFPSIILNNIRTSTMLNFTRLFLQVFKQHTHLRKVFFERISNNCPFSAVRSKSASCKEGEAFCGGSVSDKTYMTVAKSKPDAANGAFSTHCYTGLGFVRNQASGQAHHSKELAIGATACVHLSSAQVALQFLQGSAA